MTREQRKTVFTGAVVTVVLAILIFVGSRMTTSLLRVRRAPSSQRSPERVG